MHVGRRPVCRDPAAGQREFGWDGIFVATDSVALAHSLGLEIFYTDMGAAPGPIGLLEAWRMWTN